MARLALLLTIMCVLCPRGFAAESRRVALVIGNSAYVAVDKLTNPASDASLVAESLKKAGFSSVDVKKNLGKAALESALREFGRKADGADLALIYYAGHGIEMGGQNYLVPVDARLASDRDVDLEATRLDTLLTFSEGSRLRVVILDACRNNPFVGKMQRSVKTRSIGRGLAEIEPEGETLVVYAAKAGATASDGSGANSPFAEALARRLPEQGVEINMTFRRVRDDVLNRTARAQEPFTYGSLSSSEFYFVPGKATSGSAPVAVNSEVEYWRSASSTDTEAAYRGYLKRYPKGEFTELANENIKRVNQKAQLTAPTQTVASNTPAPAATRSAGPSLTEGLGAVTQLVTAIKDPRAAAQMRADATREQQRLDQQARADAARQASMDRQIQMQQARDQQIQQQQAQQRQQVASLPNSGAFGGGSSGVTGTWRGQYVCGQNTSTMQLTLQQAGNGSVTGRFDFSGTGQNGRVNGAFTVQGRVNNSQLQLNGGNWIQQPPGFSARPNLEGYVSPDGRTINGRLLTSNCGAMTVTKVGN